MLSEEKRRDVITIFFFSDLHDEFIPPVKNDKQVEIFGSISRKNFIKISYSSSFLNLNILTAGARVFSTILDEFQERSKFGYEKLSLRLQANRRARDSKRV